MASAMKPGDTVSTMRRKIFYSTCYICHKDNVFEGSIDGHVRGYSTKDGKILWDYNTARDYETINGIKAKGGSIDGPAPVIADGMLFVNSGYGMFGEMGGNVLLAFGVEGALKSKK